MNEDNEIHDHFNAIHDHFNAIYQNAYSGDSRDYYPTSISFEGLDFESSHEMVIELSVRYECHRKTIENPENVNWQKEGF